MLFDLAWKRIQENRYSKINYIPFGLQRFEEYLPGILKKHYYIITANAGIGKSQLVDFLFLYKPFDFWLKNKESCSLKIFYFSLEMDTESKIVAGISKRLYEQEGLKLTTNEILSYKKNKISDDNYNAITRVKDYFDSMEEVVTIIDKQLTPSEMNKIVQDYAIKNGKFVELKTGDPTSKIYVPTKKNEFVIFITDHLAEISLEKGMNMKETIEEHSDNCRKNRNLYGYTFVDVQQQMAAKENQEFYQGLSITTKLEPSLHGLGESKLTQRKANVVLGLFAPVRFELPTYRGYNIGALQDNFRSLSILKYRNGNPNVHVGLYFDGAVNYFEELPQFKQMTAEKYEYYRYKTHGSRATA